MSELNQITYPGPRMLRRAVAAVRLQRDFVLTVVSHRHRQRLLALLPVLENIERQLTISEMLVGLGLAGFMGLYFTAKGAGYHVQYEAAGELRIRFSHEPAI
jgi:hypothetical protein